MTVIDTPEGLHAFALLQTIHRLALEINTGLKFRQSTLAAVQRAGYTAKKTKKGALQDMVEAMQEFDPDWNPSPTVQRALEKK